MVPLIKTSQGDFDWEKMTREERAIIKKYTSLKWYRQYYWCFGDFTQKAIKINVKESRMRYIHISIKILWSDAKRLINFSLKRAQEQYLKEYIQTAIYGLKRLYRKSKGRK